MLTNKFLKLQSVYFRLLGFNIFACHGDSWILPRRTIGSIMSVLTFLPLTAAFCLQNMQNVDQLTDGLCSMLIDLLALCKFGLIIWLHKDLVQLIERIRQLLHRESRIVNYARIIEEVNKREQFISGLYRNCFQLAAASACMLPLLRMFWSTFIRSASAIGEVQPELPFPSVYPWDNRWVLNYLVAYVWNVAAAFGVLLPTVCVDTLFCSLTHNLCALFRIAQYKMQHFVGETLDDTLSNVANILPLYQATLDMCNTLNRCFRPLISVQFLVASLHLCVLCYQVSANLRRPDVLFFAAFTCSILSQIYLYCYCGECVKTENAQFATAIYDSDWHKTGCSWSAIGRPLLLSMMRAQRDCRIDGYFFVANMQTFLAIVKTSMSYVTLLQSLS
ncbi:LOW QUALITY PROTEIN: putative odorant receptor 98b [Drosophila sulfurigaster albostrigata]|uniref:LOW QUALITY PROTEIN: putative odorant receptor 98b n=1 Tax=Drosophila sulfurigaster albostrigata TaxID=89887 RepID=UPI002D21920A|nr:LOW QUALITY PROTEIN: putative odorant receptor 98b [Drosophila sulfurigaster albostrigata]